jgi:hypothetical protein
MRPAAVAATAHIWARWINWTAQKHFGTVVFVLRQARHCAARRLKIVHRAVWITAYSYDTSTSWADT